MDSQQQPSTRGRKAAFIALALLALVLFFLQFSQAAFNLTFLRPDTLQQTFVFAALSALIFLLFVALVFVLGRNLIKLFSERRLGVLGSVFRTRMVIGALLLSFLPVIFMFLFSYGLMNRSIDKWFSVPVEELKDDSGQVAQLLSEYAASNAQAEAKALAANADVREAFDSGHFAMLAREMDHHKAALQGGFIVFLDNGKAVHQYMAPTSWEELIASRGPQNFFRFKDVEYLGRSAKVDANREVMVAIPLPPTFTATLSRIKANQLRYYELGQQKKLIRRTYMQLLLLITFLVLFAATWLSLFVARLVTKPVSALALATQEISEGHFDYRVEVTAPDELGELVKSFNKMAGELETSRRQIEASQRELADLNISIEQRRKQIETILENVPTGVLSLDAQRRITHSNAALESMFGVEQYLPGTKLTDAFDSTLAADIDHLLRRADRMGTVSRSLDARSRHGSLNLELTAASLMHERQRLGYVVVFEDLSELLKAQKQTAWREVARRVAHEIKNPLTPIALSAERIRRHLERGSPPDSQSLGVIHGCAETISGAVETLRRLVDEFSTLARFPAAQPQPSDINAIVNSALDLFTGRLDGITIRADLSTDLPQVMADPEGIKRVVANLVDNAAEAVHDAMVKEIHISTSLTNDNESVEICVGDTGHGVTPELKERLFLPYFSTKERGTGLGLAIVSRIVEEHQGSVRVEKNSPTGARFIVELPVAAKITKATETDNVHV